MQEENPDHSVNMADSDTLKTQKADKQHQRKIHVYAQKEKYKKRKSKRGKISLICPVNVTTA